jgi:hypothetical protein
MEISELGCSFLVLLPHFQPSKQIELQFKTLKCLHWTIFVISSCISLHYKVSNCFNVVCLICVAVISNLNFPHSGIIVFRHLGSHFSTKQDIRISKQPRLSKTLIIVVACVLAKLLRNKHPV